MANVPRSLRRALVLPALVVSALAGSPGCWDPGHGPTAAAAYALADPLIAGLERFKQDKGSYPDKLAELVPVYVRSLPPETNNIALFNYTRKGETYNLDFSYSGPGINWCVYHPGGKWSCGGAY
jgi:hypothetical protein